MRLRSEGMRLVLTFPRQVPDGRLKSPCRGQSDRGRTGRGPPAEVVNVATYGARDHRSSGSSRAAARSAVKANTTDRPFRVHEFARDAARAAIPHLSTRKGRQ